MNSPFQMSKVIILLALSCLVWIAGLSLAFMLFLGSTVSAAWILGVALAFAVIVWLVVMIGELRQAIEVVDPFTRRGGRELTARADRKSFRRGAPRRVPTNTI